MGAHYTPLWRTHWTFLPQESILLSMRQNAVTPDERPLPPMNHDDDILTAFNPPRTLFFVRNIFAFFTARKYLH
jgi:hypothetical protein